MVEYYIKKTSLTNCYRTADTEVELRNWKSNTDRSWKRLQ